MTRHCKICGKELVSGHGNIKYCGDVCRIEGLRAKHRKFMWSKIDKYREYHAKHKRCSRKKNPEHAKFMDKKAKSDRIEQVKAINKINQKVRSGKIQKPTACESCNAEIRLEAHHEDYSKPYDVMWLCKLCHEARHHDSIYGKEER